MFQNCFAKFNEVLHFGPFGWSCTTSGRHLCLGTKTTPVTKENACRKKKHLRSFIIGTVGSLFQKVQYISGSFGISSISTTLLLLDLESSGGIWLCWCTSCRCGISLCVLGWFGITPEIADGRACQAFFWECCEFATWFCKIVKTLTAQV